jgi:hypothetical protein
MSRFLPFVLGASVVLVVTGSPPPIGASDEQVGKAGPGAATSTDTPAAKATSKPQPGSSVSAQRELEDNLEQLKKDNAGVAIWLEEVKKSHASVRDLIEKYEVGDTKTERGVLEKLRLQVAALKEVADAILRRGPRSEKDLELYEAALKKAESTYGRLAEIYQRKAVDSQNPLYQKLYRQLSDGAGLSARMMADNRQGLGGKRADTRKLLTEVKESRVVLGDLADFLEAGVEPGALSDRMDDLYNKIKAYNEELEQTVKNIADWLQRRENTSGDAPTPKRKPGA